MAEAVVGLVNVCAWRRRRVLLSHCCDGHVRRAGEQELGPGFLERPVANSGGFKHWCAPKYVGGGEKLSFNKSSDVEAVDCFPRVAAPTLAGLPI